MKNSGRLWRTIGHAQMVHRAPRTDEQLLESNLGSGQPKNEHGENASESNQGQVVDFRGKFTDFIRRRMVAGFEIRNALRFQMLDLSI